MTSLAYFVRRTWRRPWIAALYVLVYWGRTLFFALGIVNWSLWIAAGSTRAVLATSALTLAVAGFNLGFALRDALPGPPVGKRR